jgi:hypothetical protein
VAVTLIDEEALEGGWMVDMRWGVDGGYEMGSGWGI